MKKEGLEKTAQNEKQGELQSGSKF